MAHYSYLEEISKKTRRSQLNWLLLISVISMVIIVMLVIIRKETDFFVAVQRNKTDLTNKDRLEIEGKLLANWAKRDLGLEMKTEIEGKVLNAEVESRSFTAEERLNIEENLNSSN